MKGSQRISVRLQNDSLERLQKHCLAANCDVSYVVRRALEAFLGAQPDASNGGGVPKRSSPPEDIVELIPQYLAWAQGDLRERRKRLFCDLLAASFVCKNHYPTTKGMFKGYQGLLQLCEYFGVE